MRRQACSDRLVEARRSVLTRPDRSGGGELDHLWPEILPDRRGVLFTITDAGGGSRVALLDLATGKWTTLVRSGSHAHYLASGHLLTCRVGA